MKRYRLIAQLPKANTYYTETVYYMNIACVTGDKDSAKEYESFDEARKDIKNFCNLFPDSPRVFPDIELIYEKMTIAELQACLEDTQERSDINDMADDFAYTNGSHDSYERQIKFLQDLINQKQKETNNG